MPAAAATPVPPVSPEVERACSETVPPLAMAPGLAMTQTWLALALVLCSATYSVPVCGSTLAWEKTPPLRRSELSRVKLAMSEVLERLPRAVRARSMRTTLPVWETRKRRLPTWSKAMPPQASVFTSSRRVPEISRSGAVAGAAARVSRSLHTSTRLVAELLPSKT